jgi:DNA-binding transcriptional ArsR family regulator
LETFSVQMPPTAAPPQSPQSFNWETLVPRLVHPVKVEIIEAMAWIGLPLSATDLDRILRGEIGVSLLSYHLRKLTEVGALERVRRDQVRGAMQTFYALPAEGQTGRPQARPVSAEPMKTSL